eukprot:764054-Hanusia_phi.AAC.10
MDHPSGCFQGDTPSELRLESACEGAARGLMGRGHTHRLRTPPRQAGQRSIQVQFGSDRALPPLLSRTALSHP